MKFGKQKGLEEHLKQTEYHPFLEGTAMRSSLQDQKQKLNLLKPRRPASLASRLAARISNNPLRKLGLFLVAFLSGLGITAVTSALQHQTSSSPETKRANSTTVTSHQTTVTDQEDLKAYVTINGEIIPLEKGVISRSYTDPSGAHVNLSVRSENTQNTHSSDITVHATSRTDGNQERGSP